MRIRYERPVSHAASWSRRVGLFALALFVVSALLHRIGVIVSDTFVTLFVLSGCLAALAFLLAAIGLLRLWMVGAQGGRASAKGLFFSLLVLIPVGLALYRVQTLPSLYDISTDTVDAPTFIEPVRHSAFWLPLVASEQTGYEGQAEAYPRVTGRRYEGAMDRVLEAVRLVAENSGIRITDEKTPEVADDSDDEDSSVIVPDATESTEAIVSDDAAEGPSVIDLVQPRILLQGETRSMVFGFASDISIRLSEEAETTYVDMRSVSRFGPHDLGSNALIISEFLAALDAELLGISVR